MLCKTKVKKNQILKYPFNTLLFIFNIIYQINKIDFSLKTNEILVKKKKKLTKKRICW